MNEKPSLSKFVLDGVLGGVRVGASIGMVREILGRPDDVGNLGRKLVVERHFDGVLEVTVHYEKVILIAIYLKKMPRSMQILGKHIDIDIQRQCLLNISNFAAWLEQRGVTHTFRDAGNEFTAIRVAGGAELGFDDETGHLYTIQFSGQ